MGNCHFGLESELGAVKAAKLESLRCRPRRRPDWTDMMKEVESGRQLRHVQCNDRSAPILPQSRAKGQVSKTDLALMLYSYKILKFVSANSNLFIAFHSCIIT